MKKSIELINQLIEMEESRDAVMKKIFIQSNKASYAVGDSAMLTHLRSLKELVIKEISELPPSCSC